MSVAAIAVIVALAFLVRVGYLILISRTPGFEWIDPDYYLGRGQLLAHAPTGWQWTLEAVRYTGPFFKAPLYPVFLSALASAPFDYVWSVALAQAALGAGATLGLWSLTRDLHSERSGLIAATAYAVYFPAVTSLNAFMQERVYVPLLIVAFALIGRALTKADIWRFGLAGVVLGAAALARSMPVYFVVPATILLMLTARDRRFRIERGGVFLAGFLAVTLPYSAFISTEVHQSILVENIGAYNFERNAETAPTFLDLGRVLWHSAKASPGGFVKGQVGLILANFQLGGGRWLQVSGGLSTAAQASAMKAAAHIFGDLLLVVVLLAAPFGVAVARRREMCALLTLWIAVHLVMTTLSGYAGQRFREPIDWALLALASSVAASGWRGSSSLARVACLAVAVTLGWASLRTAAASIEARADYGTTPWNYQRAVRTTEARGPAGFTVSPVNGAIDLRITDLGDTGETPVRLIVDGTPVQGRATGRDGEHLRVTDRRRRAFVEVERLSPGPLSLGIEVFDLAAGRAR